MVNTVLITRPKDRGNDVKLKLIECGYKIIDIPCLEVSTITSGSDIIPKINPNNYDLIIFVSVNAVHSFFELVQKDNLKLKKEANLQDVCPLSSRLSAKQVEQGANLEDLSSATGIIEALPISSLNKIKILAIGSKTKSTLNQYGLDNIICPSSEFEQSSEFLVKLPELADIKNKKILLVRGDESRNYISNYLLQSGAQLTNFIVYKTSCPENLAQRLNQCLSNDLNVGLNNYTNLLILVTSNSILNNLISSLKATNNNNKQVLLENILSSKLLVPSERIKQSALEYGFTEILVSNTMNADVILGIIKNT